VSTLFDGAKPVKAKMKKRKNKPSSESDMVQATVDAIRLALPAQSPPRLMGASVASMLSPLQEECRANRFNIPLPGAPEIDPMEAKKRRQYALECAMRLASPSVSMSPFGSSVSTGDALPPQDVVKMARDIDRFLDGD
jgi:hypothetical protein